VDKTYEGRKALVGLPYEFLPLPEAGEKVALLDRAGEVCGEGEVVKVRNAKVQDRTPVVFLAVDEDLVLTARHFRRRADEG